MARLEVHPLEVLALEWHSVNTQTGAQPCPWKLQAVELHSLEMLVLEWRVFNAWQPGAMWMRVSSRNCKSTKQRLFKIG